MAVPNTSTFTLQDVVNEINPSSNSLTGCFAAANSKGFVLSYVGSSDRLSNFRGYSHGTAGYY